MDEFSSIALALTIIASALKAFPTLKIPDQGAIATIRRMSSGSIVLIVFLVIVVAFGAFSAYSYWPSIAEKKDIVILSAWLLLMMIAGMTVQVLATNHRAGRELLDIKASQLVLPVMFAPIVFYPIWTLTLAAPASPANATQANVFAFYAAFLNGYFWESVVTNVRLPTAGQQPTHHHAQDTVEVPALTDVKPRKRPTVKRAKRRAAKSGTTRAP